MNKSKWEKWYKRNLPRIKEQLIELINIDTTTPKEEDCFSILENYFEKLDFEVYREAFHPSLSNHPAYSHHELSLIGPNRSNLRAQSKNQNKEHDTILLSAHVDVVPCSTDFQEGFAAKTIDNHVIGRGACDNKNNVVMILEALRFMKENGITPKKNIKVDFVVEEEIGGAGVLSTLLHGTEADAVICFEPTSLKLYRGHRGCIGLDIETTGNAIHMGGKERGISAIDCAFEVIQILKGLESQWNEEAVSDADFSVWENPVQINVGKIRGGEWHGSIPEKCVVSCNIGFLPKYSFAEVIEKISFEIKKNGGEWLKKNFAVKKNGLLNGAYVVTENNKVVKDLLCAINSAGIDQSHTFGWKVSCDARLYNEIGSLPVVIFGCGDLSDAHSNHENIDVGQLSKGIEILVKYLSS